MDEKSTGHRTTSFKDNPSQNIPKQKDLNALLSRIGQNTSMCFGNAPYTLLSIQCLSFKVLAARAGKASCDPNPCCWCVASRAQLASANCSNSYVPFQYFLMFVLLMIFLCPKGVELQFLSAISHGCNCGNFASLACFEPVTAQQTSNVSKTETGCATNGEMMWNNVKPCEMFKFTSFHHFMSIYSLQ